MRVLHFGFHDPLSYSQPVIFRRHDGEVGTTIGWQVLRTSVHSLVLVFQVATRNLFNQLINQFNNTKSDLRKVIKGAMTYHTGFCNENDRVQRITYFVRLFNSGCDDEVRNPLRLSSFFLPKSLSSFRYYAELSPAL